MAQRKKPRKQLDPVAEDRHPEPTDWDALAGDSFAADRGHDDGDLPYYVELDGDADPSEEDDDNLFQNSDEALPDDDDERVLAHDLAKGRPRFNGG